MRRVTASLFHSVDGVVSDPHLWQLDAFDDELGAGMTAMMDTTTTVVLGRVSYTEWSQHFPTSDDPFAQFINPVEKLVVSSTLGPDLGWSNARLLEGDLVTALTALRETDGGDIAVCGSISVVRQLLFAGLLDELVLMTHPVVAGSGRHLFTADDPVTPLQLLGVATTPRGNVLARYGPRRG